GELELLHDAFELDRILLVEHRERVMRQNGTACGDEGKAHHCSQLPSHGVPLFDRSIARVPPRRHHAHPCNANVVTGTGRKPRPSRMRRLPMAFLAALATNGDTGTSRFHGSSLSGEPSDVILYQERSVSERSSWLVGVPHIGPRNRYRSSDRSRRLAYTGFLLSRSVMS